MYWLNFGKLFDLVDCVWATKLAGAAAHVGDGGRVSSYALQFTHWTLPVPLCVQIVIIYL